MTFWVILLVLAFLGISCFSVLYFTPRTWKKIENSQKSNSPSLAGGETDNNLDSLLNEEENELEYRSFDGGNQQSDDGTLRYAIAKPDSKRKRVAPGKISTKLT